jgi:formylglycine-generating enzyme required for sulfatase activity
VDNGQPGTFETGWVASDDVYVSPTDANLTDPTLCGADDEYVGPGSFATWTPAPGSHETDPINCITWQEAYAFCIWDEGFLPSDQEWKYAATGGSQQREYPWGAQAPGSSSQYAISGEYPDQCYYPSGALAVCAGLVNIAPVGTATLGAGRWGQLDLAGLVNDWVLDWAPVQPFGCVDCAQVTPTQFGDEPMRVVRGSSFAQQAQPASWANSAAPTVRVPQFGFRCARPPL